MGSVCKPIRSRFSTYRVCSCVVLSLPKGRLFTSVMFIDVGCVHFILKQRREMVTCVHFVSIFESAYRYRIGSHESVIHRYRFYR